MAIDYTQRLPNKLISVLEERDVTVLMSTFGLSERLQSSSRIDLPAFELITNHPSHWVIFTRYFGTYRPDEYRFTANFLPKTLFKKASDVENGLRSVLEAT